VGFQLRIRESVVLEGGYYRPLEVTQLLTVGKLRKTVQRQGEEPVALSVQRQLPANFRLLPLPLDEPVDNNVGLAGCHGVLLSRRGDLPVGFELLLRIRNPAFSRVCRHRSVTLLSPPPVTTGQPRALVGIGSVIASGVTGHT
jgi:hypothetical protein